VTWKLWFFKGEFIRLSQTWNTAV